MTLYITDREMGPFKGLTFPPQAMALHRIHAIIVSTKPDTVCISLTQEIPDGCLRFLPEVVPNILVEFNEPADLLTMHHLASLYPRRSGTIRKVFQEGGSLRGLLSEMWWDGNPT